MKTVCKQFLTLALVLTMLFSSILPGLSVDLKASAFNQKSFTVTKTLRDAFSAEDAGNGGISLFSASPSYDGCFGNQLEAEAKAIYDHFVDTYAVNRQAGELIYTFSSPFTFQTAIVDGKIDENEEYQEICETISVAFQSAMDAFLYDYPDVFWFRSGRFSFDISFSGPSYSNMTGTISSAVFTPEEIYSGAASNISSYDVKVSEAVNTIRSAVGTDADRRSVLKYVHDYICNHAYYNAIEEATVHSSEPFFIGDGGVVCEGYAKTFKVLCDKLSLPCACVSGTAKTSDGKNEAHMWNLVQMEDGKWYLVDVTWDDQTSRIYDTYFLAGATSAGFNDIISKERSESTDFSSTGWKNFVYPVLSSDKYTPHVHAWNAFYTVDTAATCTQPGSKSIHCSLCSAQKDITPVPALGHDFSEKIADNAHLKSSATCTKKAEYYYDCSRCSQISNTEAYEYGDALGHDMGNWYVLTASTCVLSGESGRDCKRCSYSETKTLQPTNHANQYPVPEQAATCKTSGYTAGVYCPDCKTWLSGHEVIPVKEHTYVARVTAPTCTIGGGITYTCSVCGDTYSDSDIPALGHSFTNYVSDNNATCTQDGTKTAKCDRCDVTYTVADEGSAKGHTPGAWIIDKDSDCVNGGTKHQICSVCGDSIKTEDIPAKGHKYVDAVTAPTCTAEGYTNHRCSACGNAYIDSTVPALGHSFTNYVSDNNATCTQDGTKTAKCDRCDVTHTIADIGSAKDHTPGAWIIDKDSDCVNGGSKHQICSVCGDSIKTEEIPAKGHKYVATVTTPTCTAEGYTTHRCSVCGDTYTDSTVPALGHSFTNYVSDNNATCMQDGTKTAKCDRCDVTYTVVDEDSAKGHTPGAWIVDKDSNCINSGSKHQVCSVCGDSIKTEDIPAKGHKYVATVTAPTCTAEGYTAHTCSACGDTYSDLNIPALGHIFTNYVSDNNATCTQDGTKTAKCDRCDVTDTIADEGSMKAHTESIWIVDKDYDCVNGGTKHTECTVCHTVIKTEAIPAKGHEYVDTVTAPTCTTDGYTTHTCSVCGNTYTDSVVPATGHKNSEAVKENVVAATCTANGSYDLVVYCSVCHLEISRNSIVTDKFSHSYQTKTTPATTAKDGKIVTACTVCGKISKTVVIPKIASISLSSVSYTYDGKVKTPTVTVKNNKGTTLKKGTDYTVTYASGRKTPGQYAVKITFKGNYSESKTLYFTILPGITNSIATATNSLAIKLVWKAVPGATGYQVFLYDAKTKKYVTLKTTTGTSYTVSKLKSGTSYKFAVRAYTIVNGKVYWASGYKTITATTNPGTPTLKVTAGSKKAALSWNKQTGATGYVVYMATSKNGKYSKIATLKGNSSVTYTKTGLTKGKTYYFKVAAYTVANGKTLYSGYSSVKAVKVR